MFFFFADFVGDEDVANDSVVVMHNVIEYLLGKRVMADYNLCLIHI